MSWSSLCAEHGYSDCARFLIWTMKLSMFPSTAVKSNGKLSAPSAGDDSGCALPPRTLRASNMWMKSSSKQERQTTTPRPRISDSLLGSGYQLCVKCLSRKLHVLAEERRCESSWMKEGELLESVGFAEWAQVKVLHGACRKRFSPDSHASPASYRSLSRVHSVVSQLESRRCDRGPVGR